MLCAPVEQFVLFEIVAAVVVATAVAVLVVVVVDVALKEQSYCRLCVYSTGRYTALLFLFFFFSIHVHLNNTICYSVDVFSFKQFCFHLNFRSSVIVTISIFDIFYGFLHRFKTLKLNSRVSIQLNLHIHLLNLR